MAVESTETRNKQNTLI